MKSNSFVLLNMLSVVHVCPNHLITSSSFHSGKKLNIHNGKKSSDRGVQFLPSMIQSPWKQYLSSDTDPEKCASCKRHES